jgi:hypothetical protein
MKQNTVNFWVDLASLITLLALVFTGLLIYYVMPPCDSCTAAGCSIESFLPCGSSACVSCPLKIPSRCNTLGGPGCSIKGGDANKTEPILWGLSRHDYGYIHFMLALVVVSLMLLHIILHWSWVCATISNMLNLKVDSRGRNSLYGIILLMLIIILIVGSLLWIKTQIRY